MIQEGATTIKTAYGSEVMKETYTSKSTLRATTIKTAYGSEVTTDADLNTLSPASVDELKKLTKYSMVFASQSSDYACLDAVNYQTRTSFSKRQVFLVHLQKENKSNRY